MAKSELVEEGWREVLQLSKTFQKRPQQVSDMFNMSRDGWSGPARRLRTLTCFHEHQEACNRSISSRKEGVGQSPA